MKQYTLNCHCGRSEIHGFSPPVGNLQTCCTARDIRSRCKAHGCRFEIVEGEAELSDVDRLRLGIVRHVVRPVLMTEGRPYCEVSA